MTVNEVILGFDFGTTNSLASVVIGERVINFLDNEKPIPSVVSFEGGKVEVGRKAHDKLNSAGLGVQGSTVRSPKSLLGREELIIDGVSRDPVKMVEYVLEHVRQFVLQTRVGRELKMDRVVATIPVNMEGRRRSLLRQAFRQAGMSVVQFIHEPLAALYGFLRTAQATEDLVRRYNGKLILVFDWGGGTLDLTLCRVLEGLLVQVANDGTDDVGGDVFDEQLRNEVEKRSRSQYGCGDETAVLPDARKRLLHECENAKIRLSTSASWTIFVDHFYQKDDQTALDVTLTRNDLQEIVGRLVGNGIGRIERLLDREGYSTASIELCLATGGQVNMPLVKNRLDELFGPSRVHVSSNSASAIADGAAWVAHDGARLHLAKNIELTLARNSYLSLLSAGTEMPLEREYCEERFSLYCVDPTDGFGKFNVVSPHRPGPRVLADDKRRPLCNMLLKVDSKAKPFQERIELDLSIDEDLVLNLEVWSVNQKGKASAQFHDLEFALATPGSHSGWVDSKVLSDGEFSGRGHDVGDLVARSNLTSRKDNALVPGEVMYKFDPTYFWTHIGKSPPQIQVDERLYYEPCVVCERSSNDPLCSCSTSELVRVSNQSRPAA